MSDTPETNPRPKPMTWEEQKALYAELVRKENRTEVEQDFLEAVGISFVLDELFSEEEPAVEEQSKPPKTNP